MSQLKQRRLGRTGLMVAELGLGAMDTPQSSEGAATLDAALDAGINFIDTAREYQGSEYLLGQVMRDRSDTGAATHVIVTTKTFSHTADGSQRDVDRSLSVLGLDRIPLYQLHDISTPEAWAQVRDEEDGALAGLKVAQYRGLIDFIGVSSHNTALLPELITSGEFDAVMLEYSAYFTETAPLITLAAAHDVGVIVMRPLGGSGRTSIMRGATADGYDGPLTASNLLRYVFSNPGVSVAIPGARYPSRIHENVATASGYEPMSLDERRMLEDEATRYYFGAPGDA